MDNDIATLDEIDLLEGVMTRASWKKKIDLMLERPLAGQANQPMLS
jgi:hypothetical protein